MATSIVVRSSEFKSWTPLSFLHCKTKIYIEQNYSKTFRDIACMDWTTITNPVHVLDSLFQYVYALEGDLFVALQERINNWFDYGDFSLLMAASFCSRANILFITLLTHRERYNVDLFAKAYTGESLLMQVLYQEHVDAFKIVFDYFYQYGKINEIDHSFRNPGTFVMKLMRRFKYVHNMTSYCAIVQYVLNHVEIDSSGIQLDITVPYTFKRRVKSDPEPQKQDVSAVDLISEYENELDWIQRTTEFP